jgi:hypothetical protein
MDSATIALIRKLPEREEDAEEADLDTISLFACSSEDLGIARFPHDQPHRR